MVSSLLQDRLAQCRALGTLTSYESGWKSYLDICKQFKMLPLPVTESKLLAFTVLAHNEKKILAETI
jgi:hypothetical protein